MFTEQKTKERETFFKIMSDPDMKESLGLRTSDQIAEYIGVNKNTITKWKKLIPKDVKPFNVQGYITDNAEDIIKNLVELGSSSKNSKAIELALKLAGMANDKKESIKVDITTADRQQVYEEFITGLREEKRTTGVCPVCGIL